MCDFLYIYLYDWKKSCNFVGVFLEYNAKIGY